MSKRLVLAIDCDDVLVPTAQGIIDSYNARYHTSLGLEHMYTTVSLDTWGTEDEDAAIERVNEFLRSEEHAAIMPDPDAIAAIKALALQHELHLVTGRASFLEPVTAQMLEKHFPGCFQTVEHTNFIVPSSNNQVVRRTKGEVCEAIGADILIDDHLTHGRSVFEVVKKVIIFGEYPWNQQEVLLEGMVRCADWTSTLEEVERSTNG